MKLREHLVALADTYAEAKKLSRATVSTSVFNGGHVLDRLAAQSSDVKTTTYEAAVRWFDASWPDDLPWPDGLQRPSLLADASTTEAA